jgi:hypothetical protein
MATRLEKLVGTKRDLSMDNGAAGGAGGDASEGRPLAKRAHAVPSKM